MDEILYNALNVYYDTLTKTGYMPANTVDGLIVLSFMLELTEDPSFSFFATKCDKSILAKLYECIIGNNCLI